MLIPERLEHRQPVLDRPERPGVEAVNGLPAAPPRGHQPAGPQDADMLDHRRAADLEPLLDPVEREVLLHEEAEDRPARGIGEGPEDPVWTASRSPSLRDSVSHAPLMRWPRMVIFQAR